MIVWIDGANGVGKSHVAMELAEVFIDRKAEYVESDLYWIELIKNNFIMALSGFDPYLNKYFLEKLRNVLEEMHNMGKMPIVSVSLVSKLCKIELLDYFEKKSIPMIHIILEASKDTIISRIENDPIRDESAQSQQKAKVRWQLEFLENAYPNAVRISTEGRNLNEIIGIIKYLLQHEKELTF